ncbi:SDR family NAD(P)-dependent oxidoreductase [Methylobacterium sp. W2]|uniref:type I polyketide synthase n=1 Tax=Methylobacterium sp. W2 TaxID=2598107 RepID=UPI001D0C67C9|nr:type I polyketide synthase [Methylobacterium sp. W2]MCC0804936.1 SDR family NAD(P)-dependent oxidoreductase [Methylobacterium sp. W2]
MFSPIPDTAGDAPGRIAIIGMAGRFPDAATTGELWDLLKAGREATHWFSDEELLASGVSATQLRDPRYVKAGMALPDMEAFDAGFFGLSPREAAILDPQHRHFLECAWEALEDAGHRPEAFPGPIGVFAGCGMQAYFANNLLTNAELVDQVGLFLLRHTGNDKDFLATRASYLLDLQGPSISVQTACSTSLVAVHFAVQSLLSGECDMALAGGVTIEVPHRQGYRAAEGEILSPDGHCRAFDDEANGTLFGSGVGIVALRRLEDAVAAGDHIYAVICGSAVNNDGSTKAGYLAPSVEGQARAAAEALAVAGIDPGSVSYIEAHGTGTPVGDPIELAALSEAYSVPGRRQFCGIGSLKTNIGHLDTAAGVAGLIKVALAMHHEELPASLNCARPNGRFDFSASPFSVVTTARPWPRTGTPRRAAVNSLGVGGTNAHVILEEAPAVPVPGPARDWQILALSARTAEALDGAKRKWRERLADPASGLTLANAAFTTQAGRRAFPHRCAVIARDHAGVCEILASHTHRRMGLGSAGAGTVGAVFMFPGGGAQYPGMGRDLYRDVPAFREALEACLALLPPDAPDGLRALLLDSEPGDAAAAALLARPRYTIPALFIVEYATARMMLAWNIRPAAVIGHSMGEYAAACIAGVMSLADALSVVVLRGQIFEAAPAGAMLAVSLPSAELRERIGDALDIAAENAATLTVATGSVHEIAALERRLAEDGIEFRRLRIDVAAHSRMLDPFLDRFRARLDSIALRDPTIPFVSNLSGAFVGPGELTRPDYWVSHLRQTVRFGAGVSAILAEPDRALLEIGPGHSLGALARLAEGGSFAPLVIAPTMGQPGDTEPDVCVALTAIGKLWACGYAVDWAVIRGGDDARRVPVPTYAFEKHRHWIAPVRAGTMPVAVEAGADGLQRLDSMENWFSVPQWMLVPVAARAAAPDRTWLVFADASRLSTAILAALENRGARVTVVRPGEAFTVRNRLYQMRPDQPTQYRDLVAALDRDGMAPDHILHLWSMSAPDPSPERPCAEQALGFDSLLALCQAMQYCDVAVPKRLSIVTRESQSPPDHAARHPERATLLGLCRVLPREMPGLATQVIDLGGEDGPSRDEDPVAEAALVLAECDAEHGVDLVAHRGGARWVQRMVPTRIEGPAGLPHRLRRNGVYLVTGGFGGLGLALAGWLARDVTARLVLVGRDASAHVAAIRDLEAEGAEILAVSADVTDRAAMERVIVAARQRFGALHGVFHAAGSIDDGPIMEKTVESSRRVMAPKLAGGLVLDALLPEGSLDLFVVFSSTSAQIGPPGQVDYAAANTALDALAARRGDGLSVAWGIWGDIGMAARIYGGAAMSGTPEGHPLLGVETGRTETVITFQALYDPARMWVLAEHVLDGRPILPGAAYAEIALAAATAGFTSSGVDLRGLTVDLPLVFEPGVKRLVRTTLTARDGGGFALSVESRPLLGEEWVEHARATLWPGSTLPWAVRRVARRAARREGVHALPGLGFPQGETVTFGPRWHTIRWIERGDWEAVAELELAAEFAGDLDGITAHPALTDLATTFGLHLLAPPADDMVYVPTSIERMRIAPGRWPCRIRSHARLTALQHGASARFDVVIGDVNGVPLAVFEGFTLQSVSRAVKSSQAEAHPPSLEARLKAGIMAADAPDLFRRVLDCRGAGIVASSIALSDLRREALAAIRPKPAAAQRAARPASGEPDYASEIERQIGGYWADLLGIPAVRPQDDFFELGGFSLLAVRLFARIRKNHDVDLPIATLFRASTLRQLASLVGGMIAPEPAADGTEGAAASDKVLAMPPVAWSPLVEICRGVPTRAPIFCIHGGQGNVLNFEKLSRRLGRDQPFYGLQARGADGRLAPLESIEEMAASYIAAIREVDAHGPYRIAGYSGGGVIAYEVAQQLTRAGFSIALLVLFDTLSATSAAQHHSTVERLWAVRRWSLGYTLGWPSRLIERRRRAAEFARERFDPNVPIPDMYRAQFIMNAYLVAQSRYTPEPYAGSMLLFRSTDAYVPYLLAGPDLGWGGLVRGGIDIHKIAATHETLFQEPAVDKLAGILRRRLDALMHYPVRKSA